MDLAVSTEYQMALQELRRGRDLVLMLQNLTNQPSSMDGWLVVAGKLVEEVLLALNSPITVFSRAAANITEHEKTTVNINPPTSSPGTPDGSRDLKMCDGTKRDRVDICEQIGGRRKSRYRQYKWDWTRNPREDDGFIWKKYGEKEIHGAKHKRMYYKCSQSTDQGCQATKQIQRANDDLSLFAITRIGEHTCQKVIYASDCALDESTSKTPFRIIFGSSCRPSSSSTNPSVDHPWPKREKAQEQLTFPETTFAGGEFQKLPEVYIRNSMEKSVRVPPDSQSPRSCQTDSTGELVEDIYGELLLQEQDWSFFE